MRLDEGTDDRADDAAGRDVGDPCEQPAELVSALSVQTLRSHDAESGQQQGADNREIHDQCFPILMGHADGVGNDHAADDSTKGEARDDEQEVQLTSVGGREGLRSRVLHDNLTFVSMFRSSGHAGGQRITTFFFGVVLRKTDKIYQLVAILPTPPQ